jgi:hypothetical protein
MKFLKQKNISKFSITDQTLFTNQYGRAVMGLSGGLRLPQGTTAQRPIVTNEVRYPGSSTEFADGTIRYNLDTNSLEALIAGEWEIVRAPGANTIKKQTLGPGDGDAEIFGPLLEIPSLPPGVPFDYGIIVLVENVIQISVDNYDVLYDYLGSGEAYLEFTSPVPLGKNITIYFGFAN